MFGLGATEILIILLLIVGIPTLTYRLGFKSGKKAGYIKRVQESDKENHQ